MPRISLGSDPEVHLRDNQTGRIVSSIPIIKRDKKDPVMLGVARLYSDNVLAEFAHEPFESSEQAVERFRSIFFAIREFLGSRYSLAAIAAHHYHEEELGPRDERSPAWATGCNPNIDCYREMDNPIVQFSDTMRTGSFHIHIGHEKLSTMPVKGEFVKLLDVYLGCASVIFDKDATSFLRRRYYGRAGEFRAPSYGVEYRPCGPFALNSPELTKLTFDIAHWACSHLENNTVGDVLGIKGIQLKAQAAINTNDRGIAREVLTKAALPARLMMRVERKYELLGLELAWGLS